MDWQKWMDEQKVEGKVDRKSYEDWMIHHLTLLPKEELTEFIEELKERRKELGFEDFPLSPPNP